MLTDFKPRLYQEAVFATVVHFNTLVVLPTGLGKTAIAMLLSAHQLKSSKKKILMLAPTRPLIDQHKTTFDKHLPEYSSVALSGRIQPAKRKDLYKEHDIIFATPQLIENDIVNNTIDLNDFSTLILDEAHRAVGDYAYVWIAKRFSQTHGRILGLTASPGANQETIDEVLEHLFVEEIEYRSHNDEDVRPYVKELDIIYDKVELSDEYKVSLKYLRACYESKLNAVRQNGFLDKSPSSMNKMDLLKLQKYLCAKMIKGGKDFLLLKSVSLVAEALKVEHASVMLETQGIAATLDYMNDLQEDALKSKSAAVRNLVKDSNFRSAFVKLRDMIDCGKEHPKLDKACELILAELESNPASKIIIFNQYRDQALRVKEKLDTLRSISSHIFFGQAKKRGIGLSQKEQKELIERFSAGEFNVMLMTSVGEEGLDIPAVDLVIFYEPVPSNIRTIQRRGRTGRQEKGRVMVLIAKGTRDEAYRWVAHHKEKKMYDVLDKVKKKFSKASVVRENRRLDEYETSKHDELLDRVLGMQEEDKVIFVDFREKTSRVVKELIEQGVKVEMRQLDVADYVLSSNVAIEYKTAEDFVASILDGRIFEQMRNMRRYAAPVLIIEGFDKIYGVRNVHPNAIRGALASISIDFGIPIIPTMDAADSACMIKRMAEREHKAGRSVSFAQSRATSVEQMQEQVVASLPGIGATLAVPLLKEFGTIEKIFVASSKELEKAEGIGPKRAKAIRELLERKYLG